MVSDCATTGREFIRGMRGLGEAGADSIRGTANAEQIPRRKKSGNRKIEMEESLFTVLSVYLQVAG